MIDRLVVGPTLFSELIGCSVEGLENRRVADDVHRCWYAPVISISGKGARIWSRNHTGDLEVFRVSGEARKLAVRVRQLSQEAFAVLAGAGMGCGLYFDLEGGS